MKIFNLFNNLRMKHKEEVVVVNDFKHKEYSTITDFKMPGKIIKIQLVESSNRQVHDIYEDEIFTVTQNDNGKLCFLAENGKGFIIKPKTVEDLFGACDLKLAKKAGSFPTFGCIRTANSTYTYRLQDVIN